MRNVKINEAESIFEPFWGARRSYLKRVGIAQ